MGTKTPHPSRQRHSWPHRHLYWNIVLVFWLASLHWHYPRLYCTFHAILWCDCGPYHLAVRPWNNPLKNSSRSHVHELAGRINMLYDNSGDCGRSWVPISIVFPFWRHISGVICFQRKLGGVDEGAVCFGNQQKVQKMIGILLLNTFIIYICRCPQTPPQLRRGGLCRRWTCLLPRLRLPPRTLPRTETRSFREYPRFFCSSCFRFRRGGTVLSCFSSGLRAYRLLPFRWTFGWVFGCRFWESGNTSLHFRTFRGFGGRGQAWVFQWRSTASLFDFIFCVRIPWKQTLLIFFSPFPTCWCQLTRAKFSTLPRPPTASSTSCTPCSLLIADSPPQAVCSSF